jgi:predicted unusual protein kinase regulating ubiquinone biosynthesis (AarF/ABC1/UbiB family)
MENTEQRSEEQLWQALLESINKQIDVNMKLKEILTPVVASSSKRKGSSLTEEMASEIKDLVIEAESLQAEEKAAFHQLFGVDADAE